MSEYTARAAGGDARCIAGAGCMLRGVWCARHVACCSNAERQPATPMRCTSAGQLHCAARRSPMCRMPHTRWNYTMFMQRAVLLHCNIQHTARHAPHAARHSSTAARSTPSSAPHGGDAAARALACCSETCACDACSVRHEAMKSRSDKFTPCGSLEAPAGAAAQRPVPRASSPFRSAAQQAPHECYVMRRLRASVSAHCCTDLDG